MTDFEPATVCSLSEAGIVDYSTASQASRPSQPLIIKALADPWPIVCPPRRSGVLLLFVVWPLRGYHPACSLAYYCSISVVPPPPSLSNEQSGLSLSSQLSYSSRLCPACSLHALLSSLIAVCVHSGHWFYL